MKCLVVVAHPLASSLCHALAARAIDTLTRAGHEVQVEDLYRNAFAPALTAAERASYYGPRYDAGALPGEAARLLAAEGLVLCFPTWWFGFPAILKGWFDRVWGPGIAYDHASDLGPIEPRLHQLRRVLAVTSLGSPWWVDRVVMRQPVKRALKTALLGTCAPAARLQMLSLYKSERLDGRQVRAHGARLEKLLSGWRDGCGM
jgi:NAD(P)H dehydrogenase (quinone)